jgi:hypothetical protein
MTSISSGAGSTAARYSRGVYWFALVASNHTPFCSILREPNLGTERLSFRKPAGRGSGVMWERHEEGSLRSRAWCVVRGARCWKLERLRRVSIRASTAILSATAHRAPRTAHRLSAVAVAVLLAAGSGVRMHSQAGASLDVSGYPPEQQQRYKQFAEKCSRCHDLSRPLASRYNEAGWRQLVVRMARKPGAGINRREQQQFAEFLVFDGQQGHGVARPENDGATGRHSRTRLLARSPRRPLSPSRPSRSARRRRPAYGWKSPRGRHSPPPS